MTLLDGDVDAGRTAAAATAGDQRRRKRSAELILLFATLVWGLSFTWMKSGGSAVNRLAGVGEGSMLGPQLLMGARFVAAGLLCLIASPRARRGWSWTSLGRGAFLGMLMGAGILLQVLGLDRTSEGVSAFLTSLTILWVPTIMTLAIGKPPRPVFWGGVALAGAGIWLMCRPISMFGLGELLGLACSVAFSFHIIALNLIVPRDEPWRMVTAQFLVSGIIGFAGCLLVPGGGAALEPGRALGLLMSPAVRMDLLMLIFLPTLLSFAIQTNFQPRIDPTRATLIYLTEPVFASISAWLLVSRAMTVGQMLGGGLILAANALVEFVAAGRGRRDSK